MSSFDPDQARATSRQLWDAAAHGWGRRADRIQAWGGPVSEAMLAAVAPGTGDRVLELAAGTGDTGFMAAARIRTPGQQPVAAEAGAAEPGRAGSGEPAGVEPGTLLTSDGSEAMLEVARQRAREAGLDNVTFRQLELEWIDLPTASVDVVLCRWGIMLIVDPDAAAREIRRVLSVGGRAALAVWASADRNPWATIPNGVMTERGHVAPPDPDAPGMFSLGDDGRLADLLHGAGFTEVRVTPVEIDREYSSVAQFVEEQGEMSPSWGPVYRELGPEEQAEVAARIAIAAQPYTSADGSVRLPGRSLVAFATA